MTTRAAAKAMEAENTPAPVSARYVARKAFCYLDRTKKKSVQVELGEVVDAGLLTRNGCNLQKLTANGFLRREDES